MVSAVERVWSGMGPLSVAYRVLRPKGMDGVARRSMAGQLHPTPSALAQTTSEGRLGACRGRFRTHSGQISILRKSHESARGSDYPGESVTPFPAAHTPDAGYVG